MLAGNYSNGSARSGTSGDSQEDSPSDQAPNGDESEDQHDEHGNAPFPASPVSDDPSAEQEPSVPGPSRPKRRAKPAEHNLLEVALQEFQRGSNDEDVKFGAINLVDYLRRTV